MKVFKRSKAYGAFEYAVIIGLVIVAALIILSYVRLELYYPIKVGCGYPFINQ